MSKHMTIINLACTITKVRKWGKGWKHSAESAHAAFAELHRKHKEAERTIETLRANLTQTEAESRVESLRLKAELAVVKDERDQLRVERDALRAQLDAERQKVREWIAENKRLQTETAERAGSTPAALASQDKPESSQEDMMERREKDCAQKDQEALQATEATEATHDTPEGKASAEGALPQPGDVVRLVRERKGFSTIWAFDDCTPCDPPPDSAAEASHITPEGQKTAAGAVEPKPGDVVRLVREPSADTVGDTLKNSLDWPWESRWGCVGDRGEVVVSVGTMPGARSVRIMNTGVKAWWPLSCIEVVKGGDK